ncbi:SDR family oxidoreductase [Candidatus Uabimicrobium sp. HlEnr_7]|uniref:SDR family oxidoreductase n=1 Tax=Candidatus Uabimicrobium helgolandensis TaxID=3095367 RepID=UPI003557DA23
MRTYLISGAGSGIGRAIAIHISSNFSDSLIVLIGRKKDKLEETQKMLHSPEKHAVVAADIRDNELLRESFNNLQLKEKNVCGIVANAAMGGENHYGKEDQWSEIIDINLTGTYRFVNECLPLLQNSKEKYKHIVVMSSILARLGVPGYSAYCASKSGVLGLTRSWAAELGSQNILVNAVCPGWVNTEMAREGIQKFAESTGISFEEEHKNQMQHVLLGKMSEPQEIASFIGYLMSEQQMSITGQCIDINNGAIMPS